MSSLPPENYGSNSSHPAGNDWRDLLCCVDSCIAVVKKLVESFSAVGGFVLVSPHSASAPANRPRRCESAAGWSSSESFSWCHARWCHPRRCCFTARAGDLAALREKTLVLKEGAKYKLKIDFKVRRTGDLLDVTRMDCCRGTYKVIRLRINKSREAWGRELVSHFMKGAALKKTKQGPFVSFSVYSVVSFCSDGKILGKHFQQLIFHPSA